MGCCSLKCSSTLAQQLMRISETFVRGAPQEQATKAPNTTRRKCTAVNKEFPIIAHTHMIVPSLLWASTKSRTMWKRGV